MKLCVCVCVCVCNCIDTHINVYRKCISGQKFLGNTSWVEIYKFRTGMALVGKYSDAFAILDQIWKS